MAACWLLSALLQWLGGWAPEEPASCLALDCLAPAYIMLRGATVAALGRSQPAAAVAGLLRPAYAVLRTATGSGHAPLQTGLQAAAAVLALGGLAEALLRSAGGYAEATQLAAEAEGSVLAACDAAAASAATAGSALLRDACSLAAAQLTAAVRRPHLLAAASLAQCQVQSLLLSTLSLAPLCQAADARLPPAQASLLLQRQAGCALGQHAGAMARGLAEQWPRLDGGTQRWLGAQVQAAARQAHQQYRQYSLSAPADWLAAVDGLAVRQLLDRLFMSCLVLLAAGWEAAAAAGAAGGGQRAQQAAAVAGALADLQFCRVSAPQYAVLLKAVLAEVPGDAAAAASLAACLPCYADLVAPCPARGGEAAWLADGVAAAKVQFLMNALVPCCGQLPQVRSLGVLIEFHLHGLHRPWCLTLLACGSALTLLPAHPPFMPAGRWSLRSAWPRWLSSTCCTHMPPPPPQHTSSSVPCWWHSCQRRSASLWRHTLCSAAWRAAPAPPRCRSLGRAWPRSCRRCLWAALWHCCAWSRCWTGASSWRPGAILI